MGFVMVGVAVLFLIILIFGIEAHPAVIGLFAVFTAPAIWDLWRDARSSLEISDARMSWTAGSRSGSVDLREIAEVRLRTALDFSQRATVLETSGARHRIPMPCLPPHRQLDTALETRGVPVKRSLFGG